MLTTNSKHHWSDEKCHSATTTLLDSIKRNMDFYLDFLASKNLRIFHGDTFWYKPQLACGAAVIGLNQARWRAALACCQPGFNTSIIQSVSRGSEICNCMRESLFRGRAVSPQEPMFDKNSCD